MHVIVRALLLPWIVTFAAAAGVVKLNTKADPVEAVVEVFKHLHPAATEAALAVAMNEVASVLEGLESSAARPEAAASENVAFEDENERRRAAAEQSERRGACSDITSREVCKNAANKADCSWSKSREKCKSKRKKCAEVKNKKTCRKKKYENICAWSHKKDECRNAKCEEIDDERDCTSKRARKKGCAWNVEEKACVKDAGGGGSEAKEVAPKVSVITDALVPGPPGTFWKLWQDGAEAAGADVDFRGFFEVDLENSTGAYLDAIESACETADAMVVAVPFESSTPEYADADAAVNACLDGRPDLPIFSTAYDTYQNDRLYGYVGAENFAMGQKCGRALLFTDDPSNPDTEPDANKNAVSGRGEKLAEAVAAAEVRCPNKKCQIYWPATLESNAGTERLVSGITSALEEYGFEASVIRPSREDEAKALDRETGEYRWKRILTGNITIWEDFKNISNGFTVLVSSYGTEFFPVRAKLVCGTVDPDEDGWQIGASPFREGLTATSSAAAAARLVAAGEPWKAVKGNAEAAAISESIMSTSAIYVGDTSKEQISSTDPDGLGYAAHVEYMRLGVQLAYQSYGDSRVGGGSVLDLFDSVCWMEGFEPTYGKPVGVVRQYYYESGDNLAYIAHVKNGPYDIISVNFRGTQGLTALTNWMVNVDAWKHDFPCPDAPAGLTCKVHSGFRDSYDGLVVAGLLAELRSLIDEVTTASEAYPRVILTGHSLGGAMATIAAYDFALVQGIEVFGLYTQGCPRVFETVTRNWLESLRKFPVWRSTFGQDPVTRVPLASMGFQHVGVEIYGMGTYEDDGTGTLSEWLKGDGSGEDADTESAKGIFSIGFSDHGPAPSYFMMHGSDVVTNSSSPCAGDTKLNPKDYGYDSCAAKCAAKTGSSGKEYFGGLFSCWDLGWGGNCDYNCLDGYCSYAHPRFEDYPLGLPCTEGSGRICCCEDVQTNEAKSS